MKVIVKVEVTDEQRAAVWRAMYGSTKKGMVSRDFIREACEQYVAAMVDAAYAEDTSVDNRQSKPFRTVDDQGPLKVTDKKLAKALEKYPHYTNEQRKNYIRGWHQVKDRFAGSKA